MVFLMKFKFNEDLNEKVFDEDSDDDIYDEAAYEDNAEELFADDEQHADRNFTPIEIVLALSLLKTRHSLTNNRITNICRLLKLLGVPNSPSNFRQVRSLICSRYNTMIFGEAVISCPACHKTSTSATYCSAIPNCINKDKFINHPTNTHTLQLEPQIRFVLERNRLITPNKNANSIRNIIDASFYRRLLHVESNPFITLLMNSDGAVVESIFKSIWITTFVINELPPSVRFKRENVVIGMISMGSVKPKKDEM